jgi:hypothetical protein
MTRTSSVPTCGRPTEFPPAGFKAVRDTRAGKLWRTGGPEWSIFDSGGVERIAASPGCDIT